MWTKHWFKLIVPALYSVNVYQRILHIIYMYVFDKSLIYKMSIAFLLEDTLKTYELFDMRQYYNAHIVEGRRNLCILVIL